MNLITKIQNKIDNLFSSKEEGFEAIYNDFYKRVYVYVSNFGISREDCLELTQDIFFKIYKNINNIDPDKKLSSYIFTIARNAVFDYFRIQKRTIKTDEYIESEHQVEEEKDLVFDIINHEELKKIIYDLKETEREILFLKYREELSYKEIANIIGISEKKVKSRLFETRNKLRNRWEELYG